MIKTSTQSKNPNQPMPPRMPLNPCEFLKTPLMMNRTTASTKSATAPRQPLSTVNPSSFRPSLLNGRSFIQIWPGFKNGMAGLAGRPLREQIESVARYNAPRPERESRFWAAPMFWNDASDPKLGEAWRIPFGVRGEPEVAPVGHSAPRGVDQTFKRAPRAREDVFYHFRRWARLAVNVVPCPLHQLEDSSHAVDLVARAAEELDHAWSDH